MTVSELLPIIRPGTFVRVEQAPIKGVDTCEAPVLCQLADVETLADSKQDYLNFEVVYLYQSYRVLTLLCKANEAQEKAIVSRRKSGADADHT